MQRSSRDEIVATYLLFAIYLLFATIVICSVVTLYSSFQTEKPSAGIVLHGGEPAMNNEPPFDPFDPKVKHFGHVTCSRYLRYDYRMPIKTTQPYWDCATNMMDYHIEEF